MKVIIKKYEAVELDEEQINYVTISRIKEICNCSDAGFIENGNLCRNRIICGVFDEKSGRQLSERREETIILRPATDLDKAAFFIISQIYEHKNNAFCLEK